MLRTGTDPFRPETFGKRIQVERLIRAEGTAEYRLKDANGRLVSKLKTDLEAMLDHLNIQIENPCAVLDQENAKLFLKGDPADKYKFFLQSTDLYKMRATFAKIEDETRVRQEVTLKHESRKIELLEAAYEEAQKMFKNAKSFSHLAEELTAVKHRLAWSFVHAKEVECDQMKRVYEELEARADAHRAKMETHDNFVQKLTGEQRELNETLEKEQESISAIQKQQQTLKEKQRALRYPIQTKEAERKQMQRNIRQYQYRLVEIEKEKQKKRDDYQAYVSSLESKQARAARELAQLQEQLDQAHEEKNHLESQEKINFDAALDELNDRLDNCRRQRQEAKSEMDRIQSRIQAIRSQSADRLLAFGNKIPHLNQLIQQNLDRFDDPPIGPLGMYIQLPERFQHLALTTEVILKNVLNSYLVSNGRDKALLDKLKTKAQCYNTSILIAPRSRSKYSGLHTPSGSVADHALVSILNVEDPNVFNALIDVSKIETKVIFEERHAAEDATLIRSSDGVHFQRNVSEVYLPNGDKFIVRGGNLAYIVNKTIRHARVLSTDHTAELRHLEGRLERLQNDYETLKRDEGKMIQEGNEMNRKQKAQEEAIKEVNRRLHKLESDFTRMKNRQDLSMDTSIGDTTMLDEEKQEIEHDLKQCQQKLLELEEQLAEGNPEIEQIDDQIRTLRQDEVRIQARLEELRQETMAVYQQLAEAKAKKLKSSQNVDRYQHEANDKKQDYLEMARQVQESVRKASTICPRVDEDLKPPAVYNNQIKDLTHRMNVEKAKFDHMDLDELELDVEEKGKKYEHKAAQFEKFSRNVDRIAAMLSERKMKWEALRKEIAHRTSMGFNKYMIKRNFAGRLKFDHTNQRLDISVVANDAHKTKLSIVNDMKQLSGGERSYTQVALLMALGECIECPFRVMDEFDVFMDSINRTQTLKLLIDTAKEEATKQFIFVTPNDLSSIKEDAMVKIQKLLPPRDR
ncbi:unnamed protein product [Aphanomyces euteiches]